jgi:acyl-CoA thioesterase-1
MNKTAAREVEVGLMRLLIFLLCFGLVVMGGSKTPAATLARHDPSKMLTVLVLGDSLSAGYGLKRSAAYPALLAEKAAASGFDLKVLNAGVSGDTTAGGLRRLPQLLQQHIDVLVLELGINDAFRGVPVPQIAANLQKVIDLTRARHPQVRIVVAGMQLAQDSADDYLTAFGALYVDLARRNHAELVPFLLNGVAGNPALNLPDMIHPNASGQKILAANVWPVLQSVLRNQKD